MAQPPKILLKNPFFSTVVKRIGTVLAQQARDRVVVGLAGVGFGVQDHRLALVGGVEHVAGFRDHADRLQAEDFLDVADR